MQAQHPYFYIGQEVVLTLLEILLVVYKYFPFNSKPEGRQNLRCLRDRLDYVCKYSGMHRRYIFSLRGFKTEKLLGTEMCEERLSTPVDITNPAAV